MKRSVFICLLLTGVFNRLQAATFYVAATGGSDSNNCTTAQTIGTPKATFASVWTCPSAGDTIIALDGLYRQEMSPPEGTEGTAGSPITIQSQTDGGAIIESNGVDVIDCAYLTFQGFKVVGSTNAAAFIIGSNDSAATASHHITLQRMAVRCPLTGATQNDGVCMEIGAGAHSNLLEDTWVWGGGRYVVMLYGRDSNGDTTVTGADNNILRRMVIRQGPNTSGGGQPQAGLALYYASSNTVENVMVIDSNPNGSSSNAGFYITSHAQPPTVANNKYYGVLSLNVKGTGASAFYLDTDNGGNSSNTQITDSVFWDTTSEGVTFYNQNEGLSTGTILNHITVSSNGSNGYSNYTTGTLVKNSIIFNNRGFGLTQGASGSTTDNYNNVDTNDDGDYEDVTPGVNSISVNPQLLYITRIESGSPGSGTGEAGSDIGADLTKKYVNGTKTADALWPWPYEDRIRTDICTGVTTFWCTGSKTLTRYVWEYLGNTIPADIYGTTTPPYVKTRPRGNMAFRGNVAFK